MVKINLHDKKIRVAILESYRHKCFYSGEIIEISQMALDHIIPVSLKYNPDRLKIVLTELGLDEQFDLESIYNIVPISTRINHSISGSEKTPFNTKLALDKAREMAPIIMQMYIETNKNFIMNSKIKENKKDKKLIDKLYIEALENIKPGNDDAGKYHDFILEVLQYIFDQSLRRPRKEVKINYGRKRIDIVFDNAQYKGFFFDLKEFHGFKCPYIFIECKNYSNDPDNPEMDQLQGRFGKAKGEVGILVCRKVENKIKMYDRCKDVIHDSKGCIFVLDDSDIIKLIQLRANEDYISIDDYMRDRLDKILL